MEQVTFSGDLTISRADELVTTLLQALRGQQKLMVDLTAVNRIDTAAAQVLIAAKLQAQQNATNIVFSYSATVCERLQAIGIQL